MTKLLKEFNKKEFQLFFSSQNKKKLTTQKRTYKNVKKN